MYFWFFKMNLKVHPRYAMRQNATHCKFVTRQKLLTYAANLIAFTQKIIFCESYKNCGTRPVNSVWFFSLTSWCNFETTYSSYATRQTFDETDILPIEFSCCMACCCGMKKLCLSHAALTSTLFSPFAVRQDHILFHSATRHSLDAPI